MVRVLICDDQAVVREGYDTCSPHHGRALISDLLCQSG
jgi:hypothetical protein